MNRGPGLPITCSSRGKSSQISLFAHTSEQPLYIRHCLQHMLSAIYRALVSYYRPAPPATHNGFVLPKRVQRIVLGQKLPSVDKLRSSSLTVDLRSIPVLLPSCRRGCPGHVLC